MKKIIFAFCLLVANIVNGGLTDSEIKKLMNDKNWVKIGKEIEKEIPQTKSPRKEELQYIEGAISLIRSEKDLGKREKEIDTVFATIAGTIFELKKSK